MRPSIDWRGGLDSCGLGLTLLCCLLAGCQRGPRTTPSKEAVQKAIDDAKRTSRVRDAQQAAVVRTPAMPAFRAWGVQETATDALARIGDAAVPALIETLEDPDDEVRAQAAQALARMGATAAPAVDALVRALNDPNEEVRRGAARALGQIGSEADEAVPALIDAIKDPRNKRHAQPAEAEKEAPVKTGDGTPG
ncbi:MAG TPA: HEAT repeat domain-containing protein [Pirellulales bacterium]|jgi:HEAT repeat protein|nr:HEAT repeat domain-containing protein [Pirellulales bacterium]